VNRPLRYCYILTPKSVLHIHVDYYLSVHNSGCVCMYAYNISGGVGNIFYQSCAQIDNNQHVYEAQI
jgi:hypothetical protein